MAAEAMAALRTISVVELAGGGFRSSESERGGGVFVLPLGGPAAGARFVPLSTNGIPSLALGRGCGMEACFGGRPAGTLAMNTSDAIAGGGSIAGGGYGASAPSRASRPSTAASSVGGGAAAGALEVSSAPHITSPSRLIGRGSSISAGICSGGLTVGRRSRTMLGGGVF